MAMESTTFDDSAISAGRPPLRLGIAGAGRSVLFTHLEALRALPTLYSVTAVCDLVKDRRDRVERQYPELRPYWRYEDMLDDPEIDVVFIALPTVDHVQPADYLPSMIVKYYTLTEAWKASRQYAK